MSIISSVFGDFSQSYIAKKTKIVKKINSLEPAMKELSDSDFPIKTQELKDKITNGTSLDDLLPEAFALVREASFRTRKERHYDVQLIGGIVLHDGNIAEMRTGEGKTLVATLPVYLNALTGKGVHVVTVNDYLARRDASWMGEVFAFLGLTVSVINGERVSYIFDNTKKPTDEEVQEGSYKVEYEFLKECSRKDAYLCDITYGTNSEFGFDYLRDNLVQDVNMISQREHAYCIVDEVDSILIDESRTPLIISNPTSDGDEIYKTFAKIAKQLVKEQDYTIDEKQKAIQLTDEGITKVEKILGIDNIYTEKGIKYVHHLETAVRAESLYLNDKDYVVKEDEIIIVDPFTGRMQPGRRWSNGIHQAIEAKENVKIQKESTAVASITYQNYFKLYKKLSGMTGTAETSKEEFQKVYNLEVVKVPTNTPVVRIDNNDLIFQTEQGKFKAIAKKVKELNKKGQPVLIGTVSVEKSEMLSLYLQSEGVTHTVLNAKNHENEGDITAGAGKKGFVTVATNMAGRGVDIKLGGKNATKDECDEVKKAGGLFVIGTERHEARRIDNQLRGRSGRQGDPGETQFYVSLEDDLMRVFGSERIKKMMGSFGIPEDEPISVGLVSKALESAQAKIEGFHFDARKHTLEYDNVMNYQRNVVYERRRKVLLGDYEFIKEYLFSFANDDLVSHINKNIAEVGEDLFYRTTRNIILYSNDILWTEHLEMMEYTRSSVNLRAYGQHDPLIEYKKEGLRLFREMEQAIKVQVGELIKTMNKKEVKDLPEIEKNDENQGSLAGSFSEVNFENVGKNDICPCGSGKKYKMCHGKDETHLMHN